MKLEKWILKYYSPPCTNCDEQIGPTRDTSVRHEVPRRKWVIPAGATADLSELEIAPISFSLNLFNEAHN